MAQTRLEIEVDRIGMPQRREASEPSVGFGCGCAHRRARAHRGRCRRMKGTRRPPASGRDRPLRPFRRASGPRSRGMCMGPQAPSAAATASRSTPFWAITTSRLARGSPARHGRSKSRRKREPTPCTSMRIGLPATSTKPLMRRMSCAPRRFAQRSISASGIARRRDRDDERVELVVIVHIFRVVMRGPRARDRPPPRPSLRAGHWGRLRPRGSRRS